MKRFFSNKIIIFIISIFVVISSCKPPEITEPDRYFDTAKLASNEVRLTILYPSLGSLHSLIELKKQRLFNVENLVVIGVFHEKERTDYQKSIEFVKKNRIDWIKFHKLSGNINKDNLFKYNCLSDEFNNIFKLSDGIIFFGGADIPPYIYNEKTNLLTRISTPSRHFLELSFIFHLLGGSQDTKFMPLLESRPEFPILGICLGEQSLNIGTGGTLVQDIWSEKYEKKYLEDVISLGRENWHSNPYARLYPEEKLLPYNLHPIKLCENEKFLLDFGFNKNDTPFIVSSHHQMVGKPGKGIKIIATSLDAKVVEAIGHDKYPNMLGIQFHPEFPVIWDNITTFKITPQDKEEKTILSVLKNNPPSLAFNKKIWSWFSQKLIQSHTAR